MYSVSNESAAGKGGIPETWLPIQTDALAANPREATLSFKWPLLESVPDLAPGDVVLFAVAVTDNKPGKPSTTLSDLRRITIVTPADYVNYVARQRARVLRQIRELQAVEKKAAQSLEAELEALDAEVGEKHE